MCLLHVYNFSQTQKPLHSKPNKNKSRGLLWLKPTSTALHFLTTQAQSLWSDPPFVEQQADSHQSDSYVNHVFEEKGPLIATCCYLAHPGLIKSLQWTDNKAAAEVLSMTQFQSLIPWAVREAVQSQCQYKRESSDPYHTPKDVLPHGAIWLNCQIWGSIMSWCLIFWRLSC